MDAQDGCSVTDREKAAFVWGLIMGLAIATGVWTAVTAGGVWRGLAIAGVALLGFCSVVAIVVEHR